MTIEFPTRREEFIGYCEAGIGFGLMIGPVLGSSINSAFITNVSDPGREELEDAFRNTFFIFSGNLHLS